MRGGGERGGAPTGLGARSGPAPALRALGSRLEHPQQKEAWAQAAVSQTGLPARTARTNQAAAST